MRRIGIFAVLLLALVPAALGNCVWSTCANKITSVGLLSCNSSYTYSGESRNCGERVFGLYTNEEHKCCPSSSSCNWWDAVCNWDSISDYFESANDHIKTVWSQLTESVQEKLLTSDNFTTLTDSELLSLDTELLSELKSVAGMTVHQLQVIAGKVHEMTGTHLQHFLDNLSNETLSNGISTLASSAPTWAAEQVKSITDKLSSSDLWGPAVSWTSEHLDSLGKMISSVDLATLTSFANEALANASNLVELTSAQLGGLGQKMYGMDFEQLTSMLEGVNAAALAESMSSLTGIYYAWVEDQTSLFITKLIQTDAWGEISTWTSGQLDKLGSILPRLSQELISLLDDFSLANARNLVMFGVEDLGKIAPKVFNFNATLLTKVLDGLNVSVLCQGLSRITNDYVWTSEQGSVFQSKLLSPDTCGPPLSWTAQQISSLGTVLTRLDLEQIEEFSNAALAHASSLSQLSPNKITELTKKFGSMATDDFKSMLDGLDVKSVHAAMLSQCDIQCTHEEDLAFLENPNVSTAAAALEAYAQRVREKSSDAALAYANAFCADGAKLFADLQSQSAPCRSSAAKDNAARSTFENWANSQTGLLIDQLTGGHAFGLLSTWTDEQITSLCHQYSQLLPSQIGEMTAGTLISFAAEAGKDLGLPFSHGALAPVVDYAISKAADQITPEQRSTFAAKFKEGLGSVANWGCSQVASLQTMAAGLQAGDLSEIALQAIKGLKANAITAMRSEQLQGFTPEQMTNMYEDVRKRMHGDLLQNFTKDQMIAAVCGALTSSGTSLCPPVVIDFSMRFPSEPNIQSIVKSFADLVPGVGESDIQVLMMVSESDLPVIPGRGRRRLAEAGIEVALRMGVNDPSQKAAAKVTTKSAAESFTTGNSDIRIVGEVVSHDVYEVVGTSFSTKTRLKNSLHVVFLCLLARACAVH